MEKEIKKTKKNYLKIITIIYFYILGYFFISNFWFDYFASQKTFNKIIFYIAETLSLIFAIFCFIKINLLRTEKNKKVIIFVIVDFLIALALIYLAVICIANGKSIGLF